MKILLILILFYAPLWCFAQQQFEKADFYRIMDKGDIKAVDNELALLKGSEVKGKIGYTGALLMKEADLAKRPKRKLDLFIAGRKLMETALLTDFENTEFHFLRLTVEEHAPKIVRYHSDIQRDKTFIVANFKGLPPVVQKAILDYCRESKVLHVEDLQVQ
ncbi:MAG TPA: hypothetical protein VFE53_12840 [Mucilaginibacter sp.]|nr:hypothetical protein [Mucilaginibacter sp.]